MDGRGQVEPAVVAVGRQRQQVVELGLEVEADAGRAALDVPVVLLTDCKAPAGTPTLNVCPETSRARLSYRRAEEIFEENTPLLANPLASPEDIEDLDGWTLHRLRHSALTHDTEDGASTLMLLARLRHASVRSLERYARPRRRCR
ncbi:hypothetical protein [Streptomyces ehimensis]|uniref:Integrase n=1 Tax=Streptomyces ehimensis TaxID=68195 RepID=A0ABV9BQT4_9ACTN